MPTKATPYEMTVSVETAEKFAELLGEEALMNASFIAHNAAMQANGGA